MARFRTHGQYQHSIILGTAAWDKDLGPTTLGTYPLIWGLTSLTDQIGLALRLCRLSLHTCLEATMRQTSVKFHNFAHVLK